MFLIKNISYRPWFFFFTICVLDFIASIIENGVVFVLTIVLHPDKKYVRRKKNTRRVFRIIYTQRGDNVNQLKRYDFLGKAFFIMVLETELVNV